MRKRTVLACEECRVRKRRCDGVVPACGGCTKRRSQCIYSCEVEAKEWNQRYVRCSVRHLARKTIIVANEVISMIESLRHRLEELERNADMPPRKAEAQFLTTAPDQQDDHPSLRRGPTCSKSVERSTNVRSPTQENTMAVSSPLDEELFNDPEAFASPSPPSPITSQVSSDKQSWCPSRCIEPSSFERLMKPIGRAIDRRTDASKTTSSRMPSDFGISPSPEAVSPQPPRVKCVCSRLIDTGRWHLPLRRQGDSLVAIYFARHARMFPVLHRPTFMKQYAALWSSPADSDKRAPNCVGLCKQKSKGKLFPATVNAVFALAALFSSRHPEHNASYGAEFFRHAEAVDILDLLNEEVGLEFVQLALLMAFYLQSTERFSKCWNMAGLALRMAQNMGLHFSIGEARKRGLLACFPTQMECEMRTRVWYACILLER